MDVINLSDNEKNNEKDFSLAFVASGDLRNVILTVNRLPSNDPGHLKILLNDHAPNNICRNIALLLILGTIPDENLAADIALHFECNLRISAIILKLGPSSSLSCASQDVATPFYGHIISPSGKMDDFQAEYDLVRGAPSRRDYRDRMYSRLRPHRVAFQEYRRFGIILPFGAMNAHFNVPNRSLFSFSGQWLQTDFPDPLESWDLKEVVSAGKAHGAQSEDIYGCLYFFLSYQLRVFARHLREFKLPFTLTIRQPSACLPWIVVSCTALHFLRGLKLIDTSQLDRYDNCKGIEVPKLLQRHCGSSYTCTSCSYSLLVLVTQFQLFEAEMKDNLSGPGRNSACYREAVKTWSATSLLHVRRFRFNLRRRKNRKNAKRGLPSPAKPLE
ncbi:hypothetical protein BDZ97DRAFT_1758356 [Flammula alnicola]|nr:hypothetical protein BDZ97DRAFT_1758356 [Flammula alnicola]